MFRCNKTAAILAAFTTTVCFMTAGCSEERTDVQLTDDNGMVYNLHKNDDGSETATYADGKDVTFKREEDNSLTYISGMSGLFTAMAASYYFSHGLGCSGHMANIGKYQSGTGKFVPTYAMVPLKKEEKDKRAGSYSASAARAGGSWASSRQKQSKVKAKNNTKVKSGAKAGFGKAGARGGGVS